MTVDFIFITNSHGLLGTNCAFSEVRFSSCTLKVTPLTSLSKEHNQPNCLLNGSKQKNKKLQNKHTGSVKSKRKQGRVRALKMQAYKLEKATKKKDMNSCFVESQLFQEEKRCKIWWSWRMQVCPVEVVPKTFCFF